MENPPFEDVFPIEDGDFPASHVSLLEGRSCIFHEKMHLVSNQLCWITGRKRHVAALRRSWHKLWQNVIE